MIEPEKARQLGHQWLPWRNIKSRMNLGAAAAAALSYLVQIFKAATMAVQCSIGFGRRSWCLFSFFYELFIFASMEIMLQACVCVAALSVDNGSGIHVLKMKIWLEFAAWGTAIKFSTRINDTNVIIGCERPGSI